MNRRKVGLVIGQLHRGGAEKQLTSLALGLKRDHAIDPVVYCLSTVLEPYGSMLSDQGVRVRSFSLAGVRKLTRWISLGRALAYDGIDLVQAFLVRPTVHAALASLTRRVPFVSSYRTVDQLRPPLQRRVETWAFGRADVVTVNARAGAAFVRDYYRIPESKIRFIPNGINTLATPSPSRSEARRRLGIAEHAPVILGVGRLSPEKRLDLFCDVVEEALGNAEHGLCMIAGDGPEKGALERRVESSRRRGQFRLLGASDQIPLLLAASDLLLLTSRFEGSPNAVLEAMSSSVPVVATDVGDIPEIVRDGEAGYVVPRDDRAGLVRACRGLLTDREKARKMGRRGRTRAESEFSMERMVSLHTELYASISG